MIGIPKRQRYESRAFLAWAKAEGGACCLCAALRGERMPAEELHHFGEKGMGQKSHDYEVARVCRACHGAVQGQRQAYFARTGQYEVLAAMRGDALDLLMAWAHALEQRKERR